MKQDNNTEPPPHLLQTWVNILIKNKIIIKKKKKTLRIVTN